MSFIKAQLKYFILLTAVMFLSCEPLVTTFDDSEEAVLYTANNVADPSAANVTEAMIMTWNIRFGAARLPFFGDACGDRVIFTSAEVEANLEGVADKINAVDPDIILLQEVDRQSKRSAYIDQVQWILDNTNLNYGAYASVWKAQVIPSDGIGRMDFGNVILSKWELSEAERIKLPLRGDQDALTQYFYLRRNILKAKVAVPNQSAFYAVNIHATAFATDDTKQKHVDTYVSTLKDLHDAGTSFVTGGDLNALPPGADSLDFCMVDICSGEAYHTDSDGAPHKDGSYFSNFTNEPTILQPLYDAYTPAVSLTDYTANESRNFTHAPSTGDVYYDRKLDYLFTNISWVANSDSTHLDAKDLSDHMPVSATLGLSD
ncbi:MAG: endonuclease/exonuclease/phosphatase family protein [Candidatus Marinimicrobia bacterium]|nr:endonuclease/exonuclease/phosphatase family protein [Candidatus Neomarinimicrobiota bacterium]